MTEGSNERPGPSAVGTLGSRPLVHLLVYARNRRLSGSIELHAPDGRSGSLDLWRGYIYAARTSPAVSYFGALAYELGLIDTATLDATLLEIAKTKRLHGEVLVARGALTAQQRDTVLGEQTCRKLHHLFGLPPESSFAFYEGVPSTEEPAFTLDPIKPAWRGLRDKPPEESVREVIARFGTTTLRLANEGPIARAGFDADETALCEALTWKPMNLAQLRAASTLPAKHVDLLVYLLVITKCAEPTTTSAPSMPAAPAIPTAPASQPRIASTRPSNPVFPTAAPSGPISMSFRVPTSPAAFRPGGRTTPGEMAGRGSSSRIAAAQPALMLGPADLGAIGIAHRASVIASEDAFAVLGLERDASVEAARAAYFRLSKLWHPDRLPSDLAPFRVEVERIFERMSAAHQTLTDPEQRRELLAGKTSGAKSSAPKSDRPRRDVIREIDQALAKREFEFVEAAARQLASENADDAEAQALVAWAMTHAGEGSEETLRNAAPLLDRAVKADRDCERSHYYRGIVQKRLGNSSGAFRDFARVVQLNPKHVDAQRELRIFEMRARKGSGEHALDALISKVKKK